MSCAVGGCGKLIRDEKGAIYDRVFCSDHVERFVSSSEHDRMISWSAATSRGMAAVADFARRMEKEDRIDFARAHGAPEGLTP